jgi:CheY-like chemotaxis protein
LALAAPLFPQRRHHEQHGERTRVLVVDQDQDQQDLLTESFRRCGCEVAVAADGEQAAQAALSAEPDIAVIDLLLPIMDGWELVAHFRRNRPGMRIVVSSVLDVQYYPASDGVLPKPFLRQDVWLLLDRLAPARTALSGLPHDAPMSGERLMPIGEHLRDAARAEDGFR